jgi:hypothetical protein
LLALQLTPVVLSLLLLAAHFLRSGRVELVGVVLLLLALLILRRPWVARTIQVTLALGAAEWIRTLIVLASTRSQIGEPATRMSIIIGSVAALTGLSALLFQSRTMCSRYRLGRR